ncbi:MAG: di-trans,poly-cis-decaprenylcistransferase [Candidatus Sungbacteria bacterium]|nr:di-trans,poly-cis-decaprenylcistransferase [Candidatus Sungbacteria bacterium]
MEGEKVPTCIGIIPDGNRRWARASGLPSLEGHRAGYQKAKEVAEWAFDAGVRHILFYAFSTENWKRTAEEVSYLMDLLKWVLEHEINELDKRGIKLRVIGDVASLPAVIQKLTENAEEKTKSNTRGTMGILLSYGGRKEVVEAAKRIASSGVPAEELSEDSFGKSLWTAGIPDPDIIIRAGGEKRLSNFLIWEAAYSELFFSDTLWPAFTKEEFDSILKEYAARERRFGK